MTCDINNIRRGNYCETTLLRPKPILPSSDPSFPPLPTPSSSNTIHPPQKKTPSKKKAPTPKKSAKKDKKDKKDRKPANHPKHNLSEAMRAVVGVPALSRPSVTSALWDYIRANNLQNPNDKRQIICDENFKAVMGGNETVTMFSMNKHITPHLLGRADVKLEE